MKKKKALGKGLSALLSEESRKTDAAAVVQLDLDQVKGNPLQPRRRFDQNKLKELAASIAEHGVVQPVVCTREADGFRLVVGERRARAARLAGLKTIPALVREMTGSEILEVALIENLQREDLNPIEEAQAFSYLLREHKMTQVVLAKKLGCSRPAIANALRLLTLPKAIREDLEVGKLSAGHARPLLSLQKEHHQLQIWSIVKSKKLSVREVEQLVRDRLARKKKGKKASDGALSADWMEIQEHLSRQLGTKVAFRRGKGGSGKVELSFRDSREMERLVELLIYLGERVDARPSIGVI